MRKNIFLQENSSGNLSHIKSHTNKIHRAVSLLHDDDRLFVTYYRGDLFVSVDISYIRSLKYLWKPISIGIVDSIRSIGNSAKQSFILSFKSGLYGYLSGNGFENYRLDELDATFWNGYLKWLLYLENKDGNKLKSSTIAQRYSVAKKILFCLSRNDEYGSVAKVVFSRIPLTNVARGKDSEPREKLSSSDASNILEAAANEFIELKRRIIQGVDYINKGAKYNKALNIEYDLNRIESVLSHINLLYPGVVEKRDIFSKSHPEFYRGIKKKYGGTTALIDYIYLSPRDCIGAVILLSFAFAMNTETVLTLDFSDIHEMDVLGMKYIVIKGRKGRASEDQIYPISKNFLIFKGISVGELLDFFKIANSRFLSITPAIHRSRVFLFVNKSREPLPRGFGNINPGANDLACVDIKFTRNLKEFIKANKLNYFSHSQIRTTVLDDLYIRTGDIKQVQALGQQKNPWTLLNHYTSDGTKKRLEEELGKSAYLLRERWWRSDGVIDPRSSRLGLSGGAGAATPGFYCLDPFDSPRPGQRKGSLCEAYGECPDCMLSAASDSVQDVANYLALKNQVVHAIGDCGEETWTARWKPVLSSLNDLLSNFNDEVLSASRKFRIFLPKLPKLD